MSPDSPRGRGRQPKGPMPSALRRGPALKTSSMRRKPQLDRITENSGHQSSMKEEDLLQVSYACQRECVIALYIKHPCLLNDF